MVEGSTAGTVLSTVTVTWWVTYPPHSSSIARTATVTPLTGAVELPGCVLSVSHAVAIGVHAPPAMLYSAVTAFVRLAVMETEPPTVDAFVGFVMETAEPLVSEHVGAGFNPPATTAALALAVAPVKVSVSVLG
ncbi:MAG: hypothetical protein A2X58_14080 [Nitrospirae bacterium GWC2_56_14]|nr:MAG: hypothetical protein A2X58_14080 [Nitrospirae bacterium GWC2_56_14]